MEYYIYCFTNLINSKSYIGLTKNIKARRYSHLKRAASGNNLAFPRAIRKYGINNFSFVVLETCHTLDEANEAETFYISLFGTMVQNGYNMTGGGDCPIYSEEVLQKVSGDNANNKKITSVIASQLYDEYQQDVNITIHDLSEKYGLVNSMIGNILHKKAWKSANKNKPNIDFTLRAPDKSGDKSHNKKITSAIARKIYKYRLEHKCFVDEMIPVFGVTRNIIFGILNKESWKASTIDLPDIDLKKEGYAIQITRRSKPAA